MEDISLNYKIKLRELLFIGNRLTPGANKALGYIISSCNGLPTDISGKKYSQKWVSILQEFIQTIGGDVNIANCMLTVVNFEELQDFGVYDFVFKELMPMRKIGASRAYTLISKGDSIVSYEYDYIRIMTCAMLKSGRYFDYEEGKMADWEGKRQTTIELTADEYIKLKIAGNGKISQGIRNLINKHC